MDLKGQALDSKPSTKPRSRSSQAALLSKQFLAEFLSTTFLVFFGCMSCVNIDGLEPHPALYGPMSFGLVVLCNVLIFGHISGAHMNPCVTLASFIWGQTSFFVTVSYVISQCAGAVFGYGLLIIVAPRDIVTEQVCMTLPHRHHGVYQAFIIEVLLTITLILICCSVWDPANVKMQDTVALKFGFAVMGLSLVGGPMSGASMNPARSLGPAVWTGTWTAHWVYWVGPISGTILAVIMYKSIWLAMEKEKETLIRE